MFVVKRASLICSLILLLGGCEDNPILNSQIDEINITVDPRLQVDTNGYYHLSVDTANWQTLHRFSGTAKVDNEPLENLKLYWESSHFWVIGDTLGYVIKRTLSALTGEYVYYDTTYVTQFNGMEVPTINSASYSNSIGEFNQMFAPVKTMISDTVTVWVYYWNYEGEIKESEFYVILD